MPKYDTTVDTTRSNTSHGVMLDLVGGHKDVLDVGCATGYLGEVLTARGCVVTGIELDGEAAEIARTKLARVVVGDIVTLDLDATFGQERFDAVVLGDVIEHVIDPASLLARLAKLLVPGGSLVISTPNVAHGSLRLALLQGRWRYRDLGLLDRTHVRFFTRESLEALIREAGLVAVDVRATLRDALDTEVEIDVAHLPAGAVDWVRAQPDADVYQFVLRAVRDDGAAFPSVLAAERDELRRRLATALATNADLVRQRDAARRDNEVMRSTRGWRAIERVRRLLPGRPQGGSAR
ncbi:MAG TPA: class I SAM-dependent methyltransferase [Propionicimonas sp.]|jgi:2-polyprenyl-3-methyl-5-hydroxy-6-metoxy-1,4-benzoquinol methylase